MPRPERPVDPGEGPAQRFAVALRELRQSAGNPTYRALAKRAHYSATALAQAAAGDRLPTLAVAVAYARACDGDAEEWTARWRTALTELDAAAPPDTGASDPDGNRPPYLGLAAYGPDDEDLFRGRDRLVADLTDRLARHRFVAVVGPSGSGKSSLLRAGLIPALRADGEPRPVVITPGAHPMRELAEHPMAPDGGLLIVDQFEEVFSLCADHSEREIFIRALLALAGGEGDRTRVVIGLRADFYAYCARVPELVAALQNAQLIVGPMTPRELSAAITEPAARAGLMVEKTLVATIIAEAASRPAALPFVSHALWETWRRRRGAGLFLADYEAAGGLDGAVAQSAGRVFGELDEEHRRAGRRILLRLTAPGDGTEDTRRRAARAELGDDAVTAHVLERLAAARLVTIGEHTVEIAHEALIRGWPTLRDWLAADRESLRAHRRLTEAATDWAAHGRDDAFLYRGSLLAGWADGGTWADRDTGELNETERGFLAAGLARQSRDRTRHRRRLRATIGGLVAGLVAVSVLAVLAVVQTVAANTQRDLAAAGSLAAQSRAALTARPDLANLLALAGLGQSVTAQTVAGAQAALSVPMHVAQPLTGHSGAVTAVAYRPDGGTVATGSDDGTVRLWTAGRAAVLTQGSAVTAIAYSRDGRTLATGGADGVVRLWDATTHRPLGTLTDRAAVHAVAFHPDGTAVATGHADGTVHLWDTGTGRSTPVPAGHDGPVYAVTFDRTGTFLATGGDDDTARLWDTRTRRATILPGHTGEVFAVAFSPDDTSLVTGSADGTARIWDSRTHTTRATLAGHTRVVRAVAFAADGRTVVTGSWDGTARIWDSATYRSTAVLAGHTDEVLAVAMSPDGTTVLTGSRDGTARRWDTKPSRAVATLEGHTGYADAVAFSPDGRTVATGSRDGTVRLWDTGRHGQLAVLDAGAGFVFTVAFSPDGTTLATGHQDGGIRFWDTGTHRRTATLTGHTDAVASVAFSPGNRLLASASTDGTARLWDLSTRRTSAVLTGHTGWVGAVAFSPDGGTVATASTDATLRLWDPGAGRALATLKPGTGHLNALAFSPDGRTLALAPADGTAQLWDVAPRRESSVLTGHSAEVTAVAFSPDGRTIATSSRDGTTRLWDSTSDRAIVDLTGHAGWVTAAAFSPDGRTLATTSWDHTARLTPTPGTWPAELCRRAGRNLTGREWTEHVGAGPYRRLCPGLPSGQGADPAAPALAFPGF